MTSVSTARRLQDGAATVRSAEAPRRPVALIIGVVLVIGVAVLMQHWSGLNPDVGWFLEVARRARHGAPLYLDAPGSMIEVNPPLVLWLLRPAIWLAERSGLGVTAAPVVLIALEALVSIGLSVAVVRHGRLQLERTVWLIAIAGLCLPAHDFAQREHQVFLLLAPLLLTLVANGESARLSRPLRVAIGIAAGVGLSLKPHFVIAWALTEFGTALLDRAPRRLMRTESCAAAAVVGIYGLAVLTLTPEYLRLMQTWGPLYLRMSVKPIRTILLKPDSLVSLGTLALAWRVRNAGMAGRSATVFAVASTGFLVGVLIQHKGIDYHFFPVFACAFVGFGALVRGEERLGRRLRIGLPLALMSALILTLVLERFAIGIILGDEYRRLTRAYGLSVGEIGSPPANAGRRLAVLSTNLVHSYPMLTQLGAGSPLRVPSLWALPTVADGCRNARQSDHDIERRFTNAVWDDLVRSSPSVIIVAPLPPEMHPRSGCTTIADHLAREPRFAAYFERYAAMDTIERGVHGPFIVLRRRTDSGRAPLVARARVTPAGGARMRATAHDTVRGSSGVLRAP